MPTCMPSLTATCKMMLEARRLATIVGTLSWLARLCTAGHRSRGRQIMPRPATAQSDRMSDLVSEGFQMLFLGGQFEMQ
jgi:hypothetical protein